MQRISSKIFLLVFIVSCFHTQGEQVEHDDSRKLAISFAERGIDDSTYHYCDIALHQCIEDGDSSQWPKIVDAVGKAYGKKNAELQVDHYEHYLNAADGLFGRNHLVVAELNGRLGDLYRRPHIGQYYQSLKHFDECIRILEDRNIRSRFLGFIYHFAATTYTRIGSYQKAINYLEQSLSIRVEQGDSLYAAQTYNDLGIALSDLGLSHESSKAYKRAMQLIEQGGSRKEANLKATLLLNMADNFSKSGVDTDLVSFLSPALELFTITDDLSGLSATNRSMGKWLLDQGKTALAIEHLNKGLTQARAKYGNTHREVAKALVELANAQTRVTQIDGALLTFQGALCALLSTTDSTDVFSNPNSDQFYAEPWILVILREKAALLQIKYTETKDIEYLKAAFETLELAIEELDLLRDEYLYANDKERLFSNYHHLFEQAIETAIDLSELMEEDAFLVRAFAFQQKSRAYSLLELFQGSEAQRKLGLSEQLLEKERRFKVEIAALKASENEPANKSRLLEMMSEYEQFTEELRKEHPAYFDIKYSDQTLSLDKIRNEVLQQDDVLLQYVLTQDHIICFLSSKTHFHVFRKKLEEDFRASVRAFNNALRQPNFNASASTTADEIAEMGHRLYQVLLSDVDQFLANAGSATGKFYIVPDGVLHYLPFEALIASPCQSQQVLADLDYVLKHRPIAYAYSAAILRHRQSMNSGITAPLNIQAFAPSFGANQALPYAQQELQEIEQWISGEYYGQDVSSKALFLEQSGKSKILHLATHALINDQKPLYSSLSFGDTSSIAAENHLYAYELFNLPIRAELVVLGACNTGNGPLLEGEGMLSLGRGFAYAECRSTVMSLWQVNDYATSQLMVDFYQYLSRGTDKDEALQKAKINFIEGAKGVKAHPYFWAGFIFHGDRTPLVLSSNSSTWWFWCVLICLLAGILLMVYLKRKAGSNRSH